MKPRYYFIWGAILFYSHSAFAIDISHLTFPDLIKNLSAAHDDLMRLLTACAYVIGFFFMAKSLFLFKSYAEHRTTLSTQADLKAPLIYLAVGAALTFLPTSVNVGLSTFWQDPNPYAYEGALENGYSDAAWAELMKSVFLLIELIGTFAFIRGLVQLTHLGGGHQASFGKALTHIIAGIFCINLYQFLNAIFITLGLGTL